MDCWTEGIYIAYDFDGPFLLLLNVWDCIVENEKVWNLDLIDFACVCCTFFFKMKMGFPTIVFTFSSQKNHAGGPKNDSVSFESGGKK